MTHSIAARNPEAKIIRPMATRLARLIDLMSHYWVDPELASKDIQERRLAISKAYLVNALGLTMLVESRYSEGLIERQIHHLPRQHPRVVEQAIGLLSEHELSNGVGAALRALAHAHPFPSGSLPPKPAHTLVDARVLGFTRAGPEQRAGYREEVLALISERWVSNREWAELHGSTRISEYIRQLRTDGLDISIEYRQNDNDSSQKYAYYRYFVDPGERAAWKAEQADRENMRARLEFEKVERQSREKGQRERASMQKRVDARLAKRTGSLTGSTGSTTQYGKWVNAAPERQRPAAARAQPPALPTHRPVAPVAPPAAALARLGAVQAGHAGRSTAPVVEVASPQGVPAQDLNDRFPRAASRQVVELRGARYMRRFRPRKEGEKVTAWETLWEAQGSDGGNTAQPLQIVQGSRPSQQGAINISGRKIMDDHKLMPRTPTPEMLAYWRKGRVVQAYVGSQEQADAAAIGRWHDFWDAIAADAPCADSLVSDIDLVLAAIVDLKPLAAYGVPASHDTVQARRQQAISRAQEALLSLRRTLAPPLTQLAPPVGPTPLAGPVTNPRSTDKEFGHHLGGQR